MKHPAAAAADRWLDEQAARLSVTREQILEAILRGWVPSDIGKMPADQADLLAGAAPPPGWFDILDAGRKRTILSDGATHDTVH